MQDENANRELRQAIDVVMEHLDAQVARKLLISGPSAYVPVDAKDSEPNDVASLAFRQHWYSIRKHLWLVVGITLLATTITIIYAVRKPDVFQAEGRVQVN